MYPPIYAASNHDRVEFEEEGKCILSSAEETKATAKERFVRHAELESCQDMYAFNIGVFACRCEEGEIGESVLVSIYISVLLLQFCWERSKRLCADCYHALLSG